MPEGRGAVSEAAQMIAEVATDMPEKTRAELARLLGHSVAMPSAQELREMRLGLLVEMVSETGELPTAENYDQLRELRNEQGAEWPRSTGLASHYGTWASALRAATDIAFGETLRRARARTPKPWAPRPYSREEIVEALDRSSMKVGQVIGQWEYVELRRVERLLAARNGTDDPRFPELQVIHKHFGGWERAIVLVSTNPMERRRWCRQS